MGASVAARSLTSRWVRRRRWSRLWRASKRTGACHGESWKRLTEFAGCCLTTELRSLDVRGGLSDPSLCSGRRGESTEHSSLIPDATLDVVSDAAFGELIELLLLESLILAQDERWRRA